MSPSKVFGRLNFTIHLLTAPTQGLPPKPVGKTYELSSYVGGADQTFFEPGLTTRNNVRY